MTCGSRSSRSHFSYRVSADSSSDEDALEVGAICTHHVGERRCYTSRTGKELPIVRGRFEKPFDRYRRAIAALIRLAICCPRFSTFDIVNALPSIVTGEVAGLDRRGMVVSRLLHAEGVEEASSYKVDEGHSSEVSDDFCHHPIMMVVVLERLSDLGRRSEVAKLPQLLRGVFFPASYQSCPGRRID